MDGSKPESGNVVNDHVSITHEMSAIHRFRFASRRSILVAFASLFGSACRSAGNDDPATNTTMNNSPTPLGPRRMPVLFMGHGSPMNAIEDNPWSRAMVSVGTNLPDARAIVCISAHWYVEGTFVTANPMPRTIHDFGGFPQALFEVQYPARGDVDLAQRISTMLAKEHAEPRTDWGLDHGTWSVLKHMRPAADVPVLQLSIHRGLPASAHVALGRALAPLRDEGVLVMGSGNITHNLRHAFTNRGSTEIPAWASTFDADINRAIEQRDEGFLVRALDTDNGQRSHPTHDHYLPLLYAFGAASDADEVTSPIVGFDWGSLSMRSVRWG
jgi:4,5-DOPA dioxygenase extradiol